MALLTCGSCLRRQVDEPEGGAAGEPVAARRGAVAAAVLARRRRDGDLDLGEAADGDGGVVQGPDEHPEQAPEAPGVRGGAGRQRRPHSERHQDRTE